MKIFLWLPLYAVALMLLPFTAAASPFVRGGEDDGADGSKEPHPNPFSPPSDEFCKTNKLGDDSYISIFVPCDFTFYVTDILPDHFSCDAFHDDDSTVIATERTKVVMWPDSCVAAGPRCYLIADNPGLSNFTKFYKQTEYHMEFPPNAAVVSVDCTADFAKAEEFRDNLTEELGEVAASIGFLALVLAIAVLACIIACLCGCIIAYRGAQIQPACGAYTEVPSH